MTAHIALFDSGVGGLAVWRDLVAALPSLSTDYLADQAHVPYGPRPGAEIRGFAEAITRFLLTRECDVIVLASNSTSTAALQPLRERFPRVTFVGMEPAVKPAVERTRTGVVAVLATQLTTAGEPLARLCERFGGEARIITQACPGLVEAVEAGALDTPATEARLRELLTPLLAARADQLVLACTHYSFLQPTIARLVGPEVAIIDPAAAVARQVQRVLSLHVSSKSSEPKRPARGDDQQQHVFFTTAEPSRLATCIERLLPTWGHQAITVRALRWRDDLSLTVVAEHTRVEHP